MDPATVSKILDFGTAGLLFLVMWLSFREFKSTLLTLSTSWQTFLQQMSADYKASNEKILNKIEENTSQLSTLREDFNRAITMMEERTRLRTRRTSAKKE